MAQAGNMMLDFGLECALNVMALKSSMRICFQVMGPLRTVHSETLYAIEGMPLRKIVGCWSYSLPLCFPANMRLTVSPHTAYFGMLP